MADFWKNKPQCPKAFMNLVQSPWGPLDLALCHRDCVSFYWKTPKSLA